MYEIEKEHKWLILTNGRAVIHGPLENTTETVTSSGQPFAIFGDTKAYVTDLAFTEYVEADPENDVEEVKTLREISWLVNYTLQEATDALSDFNIASINSKIEYIKHPDREEYSVPMQQYIFATVPDGEEKDRMTAVATGKVTGGDNLTKEHMIEAGWFN